METNWKVVKYRLVIPFLLAVKRVALALAPKTYQNPFDGKQFFILGSGRNGSTLLALLLNRHQNVFLPPEQYVLPYSIISWHLKFWQAWKAYCNETIAQYGLKNQDWALEEPEYTELKMQMHAVSKPDQRPSTLYSILLRYYDRKGGGDAALVGDHSPVTTLFYKQVFAEFSNDKYVVLLRHPLDVLLSYSKLKNNPASDFKYACWKWNNSVFAYKWLKHSGGKVHLIRYEDLVTETDAVLDKLLEFLEVDKTPLTKPIAEETKGLGATGYLHHENLDRPISNRSVNRWRTDLDTEVIKSAIPLISKHANEFGYDISYPG